MEYKELFDFESSRLLELFKLLKSADNNMSLKKLSSELGINPKTILRYMKKLQKRFEDYQLADRIMICSRPSNQFYLKRTNDLYLELFLVRYLRDLPEVIFLKKIIEEGKLETKQLADNLLISESSLRRRLKRINEYLKKFDISLTRGTYQLDGEEEQIRELILHFYWFVYQGTENDFLLQEKETGQQLTDQLILYFQMQINELQKESIFRMVQIAIWRYRRGRRMRIKMEWTQYIKNSAIFSKFIETVVIYEDSINLEELSYLYLIVQARFLPYFGSSMQAYLIEEHFIKKTTSYTSTLVTTTKLRQEFWEKKISHSKETVVAFLGFHLYYELISNFSFERNQAVTILQDNFPNFMGKLDDCIAVLSKERASYQRIPKDAILYRYFMILSTLISPTYNEKKIFICLMTDFSLEKERELGERIAKFFDKKFNLAVVYARTTKSILYADIIITTVVHQALDQKYTQPVLLIEPNFSDKIFFKIEKILKRIR
ncbi:helix-turn-helix domain-containing protein [Candidatus Enterococcus ikei]|uniref:Helix-turn-helix domain-containing protein n=1 Tax=Candidatus Enterococcus ikei TaxID=2815326 RepID=A0ABS3GXH0_9ENTE|nr:helix-turn-helix domain-containing protein [Enterococcus sp. DIV0869a]MBO0439679.1 helix-turn-helix domain-containing protein [Enterococcus sp. DIV0869a]